MTQDLTQPILTAVFVDYDNIYLSLKKRSEDAAKRFAKDAVAWIKEIEGGGLITPTNSPALARPRRIVLNRVYGNPVPRRNPHDNSTDMTSFPFVRHHFLRAGFEVIDCPPLTAQLKNSSDIKMVLDATDCLKHETRFEEFVILSGDADFTPLLHRLRAHDRRSVIFASDFTAAAYTAICDGEVREGTLLGSLLVDKLTADPAKPQIAAAEQPGLDRVRGEILATVVTAVRSAGGPVPLEALAERTTRALGHDRTVGAGWAGIGSFLELLRRYLPSEIKLTEQPPYFAYEASRAVAVQQPAPVIESRAVEQRAIGTLTAPAALPAPAVATAPSQPPAAAPVRQVPTSAPVMPPQAGQPQPAPQMLQPAPPRQARPAAMAPAPAPIPAAPPQPTPQQRQAEMAAAIQASISRIHEACQAPPLSPPDYRTLFETMATEIGDNGLQGNQTLSNVHARAQQSGLTISRDDIRFVMEVISEADPWFEQGASANLFAGRFRNFVVARCRSQNLNLSSDELDLIEAWFAGGGQQIAPQSIRVPAGSAELGMQSSALQAGYGGALPDHQQAAADAEEQFPKILRTRLRV